MKYVQGHHMDVMKVKCVLESVEKIVDYLNNVKGQYIDLSNHKY
jgi:hypothetical protein